VWEEESTVYLTGSVLDSMLLCVRGGGWGVGTCLLAVAIHVASLDSKAVCIALMSSFSPHKTLCGSTAPFSGGRLICYSA
jgi:hypothetical protein